ncbi:uncharacterized protein PITG_01932 [Phytophthora infestans T30-4]|uniref:Fibronectin type-III domain-containing protein n=1 Tax=Phytophthora infestans (strain T30-4) TaxID=403677 RepID=D0MUF8_PHYIT|nr:uncharacterized protein PITG_01932 [Phytophthora infestans T30-4]EEY61605.1 conserved hypothetical protein [Phytophthora infestans T30-4]|eukprot:XP_002908522.1 conserved hypothetical protein [Phytophthora infestans T30-4]
MALEELPNVDSVGVSRSVFGAAKNGFVYRVTFDGAYLVSGRQSDLLVGDTTGCQAVQPPNRVLSFEGAHVTSGAPGFYPEVWEIASTESSGAKVLGGTFDLSIGFEGQWINTNPVVTATVAAGSRTAKTVGSMLGVVNRGDRVRIGGEEFTVHATAPFTDSELPLDSYHVRGVTVATAIQVMDTALGNVQVSKTSNLVPTSVSFSSRIADGEQVQIGSKVFKVANVGSTSFTLDSLWTDDTTLHVTAFARKKATLSVNAEAAEMKRALSALPGVGTIDVSRIGPTKANGYRWYVTFQSLDSVRLRVDKKTGTTDFVDVYGVACVTCTVTASVVQDDTQTTTLAEIKGDYSANAVVASTEVGGVVQEVQTISTKASADNISGYFTVSFQSVGGAVINFDDTAADVRTKLQSLATIGRLNVTRSENSDFGATWTVTFLSNMGDLPLLVVTAKTLLKGTGVNVVVQEIVKGVDVALETIIDGLDPGQNYYVRAFARNENGYGASTTDLQQRGRGALPLLTAVSTSPDPPGINGMWPLSGSQLELRLSNPVDHGDSVSKYLFEYAVGDSFGKVATKKVFVFNSIENDITGTFRLQYGDDVTSLLSVHTTASSLQSALNSLSSVRPVSVSRALYGAGIDVGGKRFIVRVQPVEGSSSIDVELGHGAPDFTANKDLLKLDNSGSERGPYGYIWTISFDNDAGDVVHGKYPGLQFISQLTSIDTSLAIPVSSYGVELGKTGIPADHYGFFEINNDDKVCDTYVVGAPSSVQVVRLFAPTTATDGSLKLKLGSETTADCITLGKSGTLSSLKANLEALDLVSKVTVDEVRAFKVTTTATVTDYDNTGKLTVVSAFTSAQVGVLLQDSIIQVSRNPNDFSRHSCEFVVDAPPTAGLTKISVTPRGSCDYFTDEARVLKILDFHDYHVRFWGYYPTGEWPTLQFDYSEFGKGTCTLWAPPNLQVYGQIHTVKYEGVCSKGQAGVQTILADASSTIGGTFTLSYMGEVTSPLSFKDTGAGEMRDAIDSITAPGTVNVSVSQYGAYGKAWHVTFSKHQDDEDDAIFIQHSRLTGQNALISVYPTVTVFTDAKRDDISGSFRIAISGETTEPIGFSATHMKVTQELQKLSVVDSVVALGDKSAGDVGAYALELTADATAGSSLLTNIKLGGAMIDPTRFLAIGETLVLGSPSASYTVKAMTLSDITLFTVFPVSATSANYDVLAGLITKQIKPLPGYVGISALIQVVAVTKGSNEFQMPADHEFSSTINNVFFVGNTKFTVAGVTGAKVTTNVPYPGDTIAAASPKVYVFDNRLQTTEDLRKLVKVGDDLWLPSVSADMNKYTVTAVNKRYLEVSGGFTESITRTLAYHVSNGRKWNLVFRSYDGSLDTIDAIPEHDWRGTDARIGTRSPKAVSPNVISVGNPASTQTIHLEVSDVAIATPYTLSFGGETVLVTGTTNAKNIPWATINDDLKNALETLDSVDGVSVVSTVNGGTVIHTVSFWGTYPMKKLPLLVVTPATANLNAYVQGNNAVAVTKQDNLILESSQAYAFRIFALNSRGISDSVSVFEAQTSASSVVPTPPTGVALGEFHGSTWLSLNYWAPFYSGGAQVSMFRIEWDSSPNFDSSSNDYGVTSIQETYEVQQVTTSYRTAGAGGTFALSWGGRKTSALPFDCSESEMTDALAIITGTVNVAVDPLLVKRDKVAFGFTWKITFLHNKGDLAPLAADGRQLTGDSPRISVMELVQGFSDLATGDFTHEVQDVVTDGVSPITGSFTLTFNGKNTGTILVSASAFEMQAVLQATTASYSIKVTKTAQTAALNTAIWSVTFAYLRGEEMVGAGNIFTMTVASSQLMGTDAVVRVANKVTGSDPFRFTVTDLRPGVKYYAHVMAYNADGFGSANSPLASAVTCSQPPAPKTVTASVVDGTTLQVDWSASTVGELCSVDKYKVDWYRSEGTQEQQTITTSAGKGIPEIQSLVNFADSQTLGGYFKLSFGGEVTENIRWDAPATGLNSVKERLERLSTVGTVDVSKAESMRVIGGLLVTATSTTVAVHGTATTTIGGSKLAQGDVIWINGNKRTINAAVGVTDTTLTIDTALDITVPVPVYKSAYGYEWTITFLGGHVGPQELIQVSPSDRWTGDKAGIAVDSVQKGLQPISGTFRVAFSSGGLSDSTPPLPHNISALDMKTALENLVTIGAVNVARSTNGYGFNWLITFVSEFKNDISLLSVDGTELQGPGAKILAARTLNGAQPSRYCERNGATDVPIEIGVPGQLRYVIPGLKTGEKYAIRVRAHNSEGYGYAGSIRPTFQIPRTIPSAPQAVELLALSSRLVKLRWDVPISNGGAPISSYQIQWATSADFTNPMRTDYLVSSTDTAPFYYNIPVASAGKYYVRVFAVNSQGDGAFAVPSPSSITPVDRTPGRPEDPTAKVLSSYAILVEWKPSSTEKTYYGGDGGLPITQYMVEWDASAGFDSPPAFGCVDGTKRSFIIGGDDAVTGVRSEKLTAGSTYSIRVTAFNAKGAGAPRVTTPAFVTVTDQPPSSPQNLKLSVVTSKSVKAEWMNPLYDGGASLKSYLVEWDEQDDFSSGQSSSATIPIIREMQSVTLQNDVVNEEQFVDATVKVTNEEQVVRTTFTGVDEVQVITTTNSVVVDEVQTVVTTATDRNEVQELRLDGDDVDEVQAIRTSVPEVLQIQTIKVVVPRTSEVQTLTLTLPGAFATPATSIGGTIFLSFDSSICTHCVKKMYQRTINLVSSLQDTTASSAALTVKNALIDLANVDKVDVTRTQNPTGPDLTYVYTIVFSGLEVGGNVPTLGIDAAVTVGGNAVSGIPTQAVQTTAGSELDYASSAVFTVKYTCESYSDPNAITTFSTACTPGASARICAGCVTSFLGGIFTVAGDLTADTYVVSGAKLIAGVCSFEAGTVTKTPTSTTIVVAANDVGLYCSEFSGKTLNLYKTPQMSRDIPLKTAATTISSASVVEGLLTGAIDSATVAPDAMQTLVVPTPVYTGDIPWDVSETDLKSNLESITQGTKKVFGTVTVKRSVYSPTGNKWSGGFTWQITFSNATHPLDPFANSRDGNQVLGALMLKFRDVTSTLPCRIGVDTSLASLDVSVRDTVLESFIITNLKIPTIEIMRSAATQAIGFTWTISFSDASTGGDVGLLQIVSSTLTGKNIRLGVYETVKGNQLGGDFQLSFNGETTAPIAFNAEASEVQTELNKLGTIKPSSVVVSRGGPTSTQVLGYTWYVTFRSSKWVDPTSDHSGGIDGNWKSSSPASWDDVWESGYSKAWGRHVGHTFLVKCITDGLTTTASDGSQNCVPSVSTTGVGPIKGSFTVSIDSRPATYSHMAVNSLVTSVSIAHNAWATKEQSGYTGTSVEEILEKMDNVGDVAVTRGDVVTNTGGYSWTVTFLRDASDASHACEQLEEAAGSLLCNAPGNVPEMVPISTSLTGASSVASVVTIKDGTILRGDFTDFRVQGDAGVAARYFVSLVDMDTSNTGATTWLGLSILLPWNADENLVERQLEAAATNTGRQVSVKRTEHGKYGEMSWLVRFISNPTFTPPGAGDLPDITTTFAAEAGSSKYDMTVTQVTPGSKGLSGSFLLDFHSSSFGPREIFFDEDPDRLQRKLNEMDTVGRVTVKRYKYPSSATGCTDPSCSGGWDDVRVKNRGTRGGYRWRIRFMQATGDYKGFTFPPGSGDVASLSVSRSALQGTGVSVDVYTNVPGSSPSVGAFALNTSESQTPALPYSSSAEEMKLGIEAMDLFGEVDVTQGYLLTQKIPGATATLTQDGVTATITGVDDIRQYIARTDIIRFGSTSVNNLVGTNGDAPFTGLIDTSRVKVTARSPVVVANAETTRLLYPGMQLRIDGLVYNVQRTGHEVQTLTATRPSTTWSTAYVTNAFQLTMTRDVLVSRVGPSTFGSRIGYVYSVYFTGESVAGDVAPLKVDYCAGIGDATVTAGVITHGGKIPQQRLMFATDYGQVEDTKGFFQLVLNSQSSACIKWGAPASDVKLALEKTPLSSGNVVVTRSGNGTSQTEIQRIRMTANTAVTAVNGLFRVQFTLNGQTSATSCLKYGVSAEGLEVALNGLSNLGTLNNIDHINVTRTGDGGADWGYGYEYLIHFQGPISGGTSRVLGDVPQLVIGNVGTGACSSGAQDGMYPALMIETVRQGAPGFTYDIFFMDYKAAPTVNLMSLKSKDNGDNVCLDGWAQKGGSVRKAYVEMVELGGSSEVQVVTVKDTGTGSYAITFGGQTSPCLLFTASANDVATAIQTLTGSGVGDILVSLDKDLLVSPDRAIYRITFVGDAVTGKLPLLGAVQNSDTACANTVATTNIVVEGAVEGGGPSGEFALTTAYDGENPNSPHTAHSVSQQFRVMDEQFEIQQLVVSNPSNNFVSGETYTLKVLGTNTNPIPWDVSETALQLELTSTARIALTPTVVGANDLIVTRRTNADVAPHGFIYMIYFSGSSVTGNVAATTVVAATGAHIAPSNIVASTIRQGVAGISTLTANSIPLALPEASSTAARYLSSAVEQKLEVYKVNGFLWMIKFKSSLGNIPKLGKQTSGLLGGSMTIQDDFVSGSASNTYAISNLLPGITYYAHVAAWTDVGIGSFSPSASVIPSSKASGVQNLAAGYALYEREVQEIRLAASHVMEIQEISTTAARVAEVQTLRTFAPPSSCPGGNCIRGRIAFRVPTVQTVRIWASAAILSGTFTLLFEREVQNGNTGTFSTIGAKTGAISWNAPAFTVKTSLATVVNGALGTNDVVVTRDGDASVDFQYGYVFQITFIGNNVAGETKKIVCDDKTFIATGGATVHCDVAMNTDVAMGTDTAVQQIVVSAKKPLAVGSYKVHFNYLGLDQVSGCIPFDASAKTMETSLEAMPNIDNVYVTRETDVDGFVYTVFFHGNGVYGNTPLMIWLSSDTGCTAFQTMTNNALTSVGVDGKVEIKMLDWGGFNTANTFVYAANNPITGDADTAAQLTTDLNRLPVFGDVLVSQSIADEQGGYIWTIVFEDSQGNLPQFICAVDPSTFTATGSGCETDTRTDGNVLNIIKTALEAMPRMGTVQVKRSEPSPQFGYTWTITFLDYKGDVPMLRVTSLLVGTSSQILVREVRKGNALGGMFTLTYANAVTTPIGWNAAAMAAFIPDGSSMQEKLEALDVVGKVNVVRTGPDEEGGYTWVVTFLDNFLNSGDVPLLRGNASALTGEGAVVFTKEVTKGSNAVGDQLWLSFDPPATDNGSPITKYQVRWDTSDKFTANPADVFISDAEILYRTLRITTSAASLAWSNHMIRPVDEVQKLKILTVGTFELSFRGETTATLTAVAAGTTAGATTVAGLETALETLSSVGSVDVSSAKTVLEVGAEVLITFTAQPGDLPLLKPSSSKASVDEIQTGKTNFRKEVVVFSCTATAGTVRFSYNGEHADSISVSSATQLVLCKSPTPDDVKIVFDRVYGDITLSIDKGVDAGANAQIVFNTEASIDGVYNDDPALTMSGTFQVGYQGLYTRPLNAESSADQLRYALEDLDSIRTASVNRELSYRPVPGKVDVTEGEIFVTCSAGETCSFYSAAYGLPGYKIRIGGDWYTVRADLSSPGLHKTRLYLGDLNGREIGYLGSTDTAVSVYEWTKGYVWTVDMLSVASLSYIRAKVPRLYPTDSTVRISGSGCDKCYYLPTQTSKKLTMGQLYFVEPGHSCANFNGQAYPLYYYTYPPQVLSGSAIQVTPPFRYVISNLVSSKTYYVRVAAVNSVPVQQIALSGEPPNNRQWSYHLTAITADKAPDPPLSVYLNPFSSTMLELQIQPSTRDGKGTGGTAITAFWIDVDTVSTFDSVGKRVPVEVLENSGNTPELYSGGPRLYLVTGLVTGTRYFAQVKSVNSIGYSRASIAPNPQTPTRHPNVPVNVRASTLTVSSSPITAATVTWQKPADAGGLPLTGYKVEWWRPVSRPEIQTIELKWTTQPSAAPFTLSFGGLSTAPLPMDVSAANLRFALMGLASLTNVPIGHIEVSRVAVNIVQGFQWIVTFSNTNQNAGNQPLIQYLQGTITAGSGVSGRVFEVQPGVAVPATNSFPGTTEAQVLVTYHTTPVGGYFRLSYKGSAWTNYLSATVSAADLKLALEALPTIGVVTVNVETMLLSGAAWSNGRVWTITFDSNVGNLAPLVVDSSRITPAAAFVGVKDGDNAVDTTGVLCLPDGTTGCPGLWPAAVKTLKQQAAPLKSIAQLSTPGEYDDVHCFRAYTGECVLGRCLC